MTRLNNDALLRRETACKIRGKAVVIELGSLVMRLRLKGARWGYEVDYESIFLLGARKAAEEERRKKQDQRRERRRRRMTP
jgi:hypothetical protein